MLHTDLIAPIPELLRRHAAARGSKIAYRDAQSSVTYAELLDAHRQSRRASRRSRHRGERHRRDPAAEFGAVGRNLLCDHSRGRGQRADQLRRDRAGDRLSADRCELPRHRHHGERGDLVAKLKGQAPNLKTLIVTDRGQCSANAMRYAKLIASAPKSAPRDPASLHEPTFILYTSGTTGRAKGVLLTVHGMLWIVAACWAPITGLCERDTVLSPLPLFHSYALNLSVLASSRPARANTSWRSSRPARRCGC